jgi:hypothetical protein
MKAIWILLAAASLARAEPTPRVRRLQGLEEQQAAVHAKTEIPGTASAIDARTGAVTVRAAGAEMRLTVPAATAETLRPGAPVTVEVVLVREPPAPGTPGGGPAPATIPGREVHRPAGADPRTDPDTVGPPPAR